MKKCAGILSIMAAALIITAVAAFLPADTSRVYAASAIQITDLKADAAISQQDLQTDISKLGYRYVKLTWSSSSAADKYIVYVKRSTGYERLVTVHRKIRESAFTADKRVSQGLRL
jgi:hypothetical protein